MADRYIAQTRLPEIGKDGQSRLKRSTVLIVGCGALGSPAGMLLAAAGVGRILIADFDTIEISNLHRQTYYKEQEAGMSKVEALVERMRSLNSEIEVIGINRMMTQNTLSELPYIPDMVVDASDNPATTYLLEKYCLNREIPICLAGVSGWKGQIYTWRPGALPFSEIIPIPSEDSGILPCSITGIMGPLASMMASIQSAETIKCILDIGATFTNRLISIDLLTNEINQLELDR